MAHQIYKNKNGDKVVSVTTALGIINCPALYYWGVKMAKEGNDPIQYTKDTAEIGTLTHSIAEYYTNGTPIEWDKYSREQIESACKAAKGFFEWEKNQWEFKPLESEIPLVSERYQYGGCIDLYCRLNGKYTLVDYKTSSAIRDTHIMQVSAYKSMLQENGYKVDRAVILRIGRDDEETPFEYRELIKKELQQGFKVFKSALKLYKDKREFEKIEKELNK